MKHFVIILFASALVFSFAAIAGAQDNGCPICCIYVANGRAQICQGFFLPNPNVSVSGPLGAFFAGKIVGKPDGKFWGRTKAPVGSYIGNQYNVTGTVTQFGSQGPIILNYSGTSKPWHLHCFMAGAKVRAKKRVKVRLIDSPSNPTP